MKKTFEEVVVLRRIGILFSVFILFMFFNTDEIQAAKKLSDVNTYSEEINYLNEMGIIQGYKDGSFKPNRNVTNTHVAVMLGRALKLDLSNPPDPGFKDVPKSHYAYKEIAAAAEAGIFPKGHYFYPSKPSTRQSMARALVVGFNLSGDRNVSFPDVPSSNEYKDYISTLASNEITTGYTDGTFKPKNELSRAHFSVFVARSLNDKFKAKKSQTLTSSEIVKMHDKRVVTIETEYGSGSGVLVGNGIILTNEHVIEGITEGEIVFNDGKRVEVLGIVAKDVDKDLALIKIAEDIRFEKVSTRAFEQLVKGEKVVAIGSPYGFMNTVSEGLISGLRSDDDVKVIQTSASITYGSSGGGLFDAFGNLVGITTYGSYESSANLNFAVSISEASQWDSILAMPYDSIDILPEEPIEPSLEMTEEIFRNLVPGMTKAEVKALETGGLTNETADSLTFNDADYFGFPVELMYTFENDELVTIRYSFLELQTLNLDELDIFFLDILDLMEMELGTADTYDFDWADDNTLAAYWESDYTALLNVSTDDHNVANIVIISE